MKLNRVRYSDLAALPSIDEIKARKAAAVRQDNTAALPEDTPVPAVNPTAEPYTVVKTATVPETETVAESKIDTIREGGSVEKPETITVIKTATVPETGAVIKTDTVSEKDTVIETDTIRSVSVRPRRAAKVQDGHSSGEQCLYAAMWENARTGSRDYRTITAGWDRLGRMANLTAMNARIACRRLISKLAVEVIAPENSDTRTGRTYQVWAWIPLLERRNAAGMVWYVKTRGVEFVRPPASDPENRAKWDAYQAKFTKTKTVPDSDMVSESETVLVSNTVAEKKTGTLFVSERETVSVSETPLKHIESKESITSSSLVEATSYFDDDARRQLIANCRRVAEDATIDEIAHFTRLKQKQLLRGNKGIDNPVGLLLTAVPKCFEPESLSRYRSEVQSTTSVSTGQQEDIIREAAEAEARYCLWTQISEAHKDEHGYDMQAIADDPQLDEKGREQAKRLIERLGRFTKSGL